MPGKVTLVGAGPGDPGLLTRKGLEALERAEQARRNVAVVLEKTSPATLAAAAKKSAAAGIADSRRDDPAKTIR